MEKKEKSGYMTLIPIYGPLKGATNSSDTSNDFHNMPLQEKHCK